MNKHVERSRATMNAILDQAFRLFLSHGIEGVTMGEIAKAAGVHRSSLYRYFQSREEIGYAIQDRLISELLESQQPRPALEGSGWERVADFMRQTVAAFAKNRDYVRFFALFDAYASVVADQTELAERTSRGFGVLQGTSELSKLMRMGIEDGSIRGDLSPERMAQSLWIGYFTAWHRVIMQREVLQIQLHLDEPDEISTCHLEMLLSGLRNT